MDDSKHSPENSKKDLETLNSLGLNYSMDLLYGLPGQRMEDLKQDLEIIKSFSPPHISPYNLTLAKGHKFDQNRPNDEVQIEMMDLIENELKSFNCYKYEVSNFAKPGFEAVHNKGYWNDVSYFSFGMGAHSYDKDFGDWGRRYWNTAHYDKYKKCIDSSKRPYQGEEILKLHESFTDYVHTHLRQVEGLNKSSFIKKFNGDLLKKFEDKTFKLISSNLLEKNEYGWALSKEGFRKTNQVFLELYFSQEDLV